LINDFCQRSQERYLRITLNLGSMCPHTIHCSKDGDNCGQNAEAANRKPEQTAAVFKPPGAKNRTSLEKAEHTWKNPFLAHGLVILKECGVFCNPSVRS